MFKILKAIRLSTSEKLRSGSAWVLTTVEIMGFDNGGLWVLTTVEIGVVKIDGFLPFLYHSFSDTRWR